MKQTTKTLITLMALLSSSAAIGLYAYFEVFQKDKAEAEHKDRVDRLFAPNAEVAPKDGGTVDAFFTKLTIAINGSDSTTLVREPGGEWKVTAPLSADADKVTLDGVTSFLQTSKFKKTVDEHPTDSALKQYGLAPADFTVTAEAQSNGKTNTVKLQGGVENTFDGSVFMRRDDDKTVYAAEGGSRWSLRKTTFDLREKHILKFETAKVVAIEAKTLKGEYRVERGLDKTWKLTKPTPMEADANTIDSMLASLTGQQAVAFPVDSPEKRKNLGIEKPVVEATITLADHSSAHLRFGRSGNEATAETHVLLETTDGKVTLAAVNSNAAGALDKAASELFDRRVTSFKSEDTTGLVIRNPGTADIVLHKEHSDGGPDTWWVTAPKAGKAMTYKPNSLMWAVSNLRATARIEEKPKDVRKYGLDPKSSRSIHATDAAGKSLVDLSIGSEVKGKKGVIYVMGNKGIVFEANASGLGDVPKSADDLIEKPPADAGK